MAIDAAHLRQNTHVQLLENGKVMLTDESDDPFLPTFIELDAQAAIKLFDFLLLHQDRLHRHAQEQK
jgi:hypothetical protein